MSESIIEVVVNSKGVVRINGDAIQDQTLEAIVSDKDGVDQGNKILYQWSAGDKPIDGATKSTYKLTQQ